MCTSIELLKLSRLRKFEGLGNCGNTCLQLVILRHFLLFQTSPSKRGITQSKTERCITTIYLGRVDSSGVRIYYTDKLRQFDSGVVSVGVAVNHWHIIPPEQKQWMSVGYCTAKCTNVSMGVSSPTKRPSNSLGASCLMWSRVKYEYRFCATSL